jgi:hypothetical protein
MAKNILKGTGAAIMKASNKAIVSGLVVVGLVALLFADPAMLARTLVNLLDPFLLALAGIGFACTRKQPYPVQLRGVVAGTFAAVLLKHALMQALGAFAYSLWATAFAYVLASFLFLAIQGLYGLSASGARRTTNVGSVAARRCPVSGCAAGLKGEKTEESAEA